MSAEEYRRLAAELKRRKTRTFSPLSLDAETSEKLEHLRQGLVEADRLDGMWSRYMPEYEGRDGALLTLMAVMSFLTSVDIQRPRTLYRIVEALRDADRGATHPLTEPHPKGRPQPTDRTLALRAVAAAAVQVRVDSGETKRAAAKTVTDWVSSVGSSFAPTPSAVMQWRDAFIRPTGHPIDDIGRRYYALALRQLQSIRPGQIASRVQAALRAVIRAT